MRTHRQDSDDTKRYVLDWDEELLDNAIISSSDWTVEAGLTGASETIDARSTYIHLSGGTVDTTYKVTNKVTSSKGLVHSRSFNVQVVVK